MARAQPICRQRCRRPLASRASNSRGSRATILLSVLVVVVIGTLIGTTMTMIAGAQRASVESAGKRAQARALALSGLRAVVAELADQKSDLLRGDEPRFTNEWTLFESQEGGAGVVRLLPLGPDGARFSSESSKLDLNSHSAETLGRLTSLGPGLAQQLADRAAAQPYTSLGALIEVEGIGPDDVFGSVHRAADSSEGDSGLDSALRSEGEPTLSDLLTVFAFDPNVQTGLDSNRPDQFAGRRRINLNRDWSDDLDRAIRQRYDDNLAVAVRGAMQSGLTFADDARMIEILVESGLAAEFWGALLDGFTAWEEPYHYGKVDINRARAEVIAALPGLDEGIAAEIVEVRSQLGTERKRSIAWPVVEGLMSGEQFKEAGPWITTRSLQWRVRIMGGFQPARAAAGSLNAALAEEQESEALEQAVILEAVIDISGPSPRIAYLRDLTLYETAAQVRTASLAALEARSDAFSDSRFEPDFRAETSPAGADSEAEGFWEAPLWSPSPSFADEEESDSTLPIDEDGWRWPSLDDDDDEAGPPASTDTQPRRLREQDRRIGRWRG